MNNRHYQNTNFRKWAADWLLFLMLFCGLFLLWGSFGDPDFKQQPVQIESVASARPTTSARSIVFNCKLRSAAGKAVFSGRFLYDLRLLFVFNRLEKTKITAFSKPVLAAKTGHRFLPNKTIPQSSDEESVTFHRG